MVLTGPLGAQTTLMQGVERLVEFVLQPAVALRLTFISCAIFEKTLHQGGEGGVALGGPQARPLVNRVIHRNSKSGEDSRNPCQQKTPTSRREFNGQPKGWMVAQPMVGAVRATGVASAEARSRGKL